MKAHFSFMIALAIAFASNTALAQFKGDVYFAAPTVAVAANDQTSLEIRAFTGASVLGAIHFEFEFKSDELEIISVEPGTAVELSPAFRYAMFADRIGMVALNSESVAQPFGTISLARLTVRPRVVAGQTISVRVSPRDAIDANSQRITTRGFGASIAVISPPALSGTGSTSKSKPATSPLPTVSLSTLLDAQTIGGKIARPGHARKIIMPLQTDEGVWVAVEVPVNTVDANAPSDADTNAIINPHPIPAGSTTEP